MSQVNFFQPSLGRWQLEGEGLEGWAGPENDGPGVDGCFPGLGWEPPERNGGLSWEEPNGTRVKGSSFSFDRWVAAGEGGARRGGRSPGADLRP